VEPYIKIKDTYLYKINFMSNLRRIRDLKGVEAARVLLFKHYNLRAKAIGDKVVAEELCEKGKG
jgi:hypothetical protein